MCSPYRLSSTHQAMADATPAWPGICFDNSSHDWMIANIPMDKVILRKWLKAGYIYQNELFLSHAGTPQGGIISPVLTPT